MTLSLRSYRILASPSMGERERGTLSQEVVSKPDLEPRVPVTGLPTLPSCSYDDLAQLTGVGDCTKRKRPPLGEELTAEERGP